MSEPDPVIALVDAASRALAASGEAQDAEFEATRRFRAMGGKPAIDGALIHRGEDDIALSLHGSVMLTRDPADDRKTFSEDFIGFLRRSPRYKYGAIPHPDMPPPNMRQTKETWPEAQARADEIVAAWDAREAETARRREAAGIPAAAKASEAADKAFEGACRAAISTTAATLAGVQKKAEFLATIYGSTQELSAFIAGCNAPQSDEMWGLSVARDLLAIRGQA